MESTIGNSSHANFKICVWVPLNYCFNNTRLVAESIKVEQHKIDNLS